MDLPLHLGLGPLPSRLGQEKFLRSSPWSVALVSVALETHRDTWEGSILSQPGARRTSGNAGRAALGFPRHGL